MLCVYTELVNIKLFLSHLILRRRILIKILILASGKFVFKIASKFPSKLKIVIVNKGAENAG